jgi:hypothetical protein
MKAPDRKLTEDIDKFLEAEAEEELAGETGWGAAEPESAEGSPEDIAAGQKILDSWDRMVFNEEEEDWEIQIDDAMQEKVPAVVLIGESGVGKTTMIDQIAKKYLDTPVAYFNAPNMDPFIHLVGLPHISKKPETEELVLAFVRKSGIEHSELLVLDEINRVPPATQNALFELIATRQINGEKFGKLRMVWGAMNPPRSDIEGRSVTEVEDALVGRFHEVIEVFAKPKMKHYVGRNEIGAYVARKCLRWWYQFIKDQKRDNVQLQEIVTPRVLEYMMIKIQKLENRKMGKGRPITPREYNVGFAAVTKHHRVRTETRDVAVPYNELKQSFLGKELFAVSSLMDTSPEVDEKVKEIIDPENPEAGKMAASIILGAIKTERLRPTPLIPFYRIGIFSRVLTAMRPDDANIIISGKPEIAGFLFAKCAGNDQVKMDYSKGNKEHPVWQPATQGELAIFKHLEYPIVRAVKKSTSFAKPAAPGAPGAAPAKPGAVPAATPARPGTLPPKKPGVP